MKFIVEKPKSVLLLMVLLTLAIGHRTLFIKQDNSPSAFFAVDQKAQETYRELVKAFSTDEVVLIELRGAKPGRPRDLQAIESLARAVAGIRGVKNVTSVADIYRDPLDKEANEPAGESEARAVSREVRALPMYRVMGLARPDIPALSVVATLIPKGPEARTRIADALYKVAAKFDRRGYQTLVAGLTTAHAAIDRESRKTMMVFMPLVVLFISLIGFMIFRSIKAVLAMFLPVAGSIMVGMGVLNILGEPLTLVSGVMPPLVMAIGFAGATHLVSRYGHLYAQGLSREMAVRQTVKDKFTPTAFAFITTAVGFGSLLLSDVHSIQVLGAISASALVAALFLITMGTPALLLLLKPKIHMPAHRHRALQRIALWSLKRRWWVVGVAALSLVPIISGFFRLHSSIDGMELLGDQVKAKQDFRKLQSEGLGLYTIDLWIQKKVIGHEMLLQDARRLNKLAAAITKEMSRSKSRELLLGAMGIHNLLEVFHFRTTGKRGLPQSLAALEVLDEKEKRALQLRLTPFWNPEKGIRLSLLTNSVKIDDLKELVARSRQAAEALYKNNPVKVTGHYMMLLGTPGKLMRTMILSLGTTVGIITLLFLIAFRSFLLTLAGMAANLLPVIFVVGMMGWLGILSDVATVMVGSVAFGLAVDDTFHYLYHRRKSGSIVEAALIAGQGIVATSFMLAVGLSVLGFSGFNPVVRFGLLTALAVLIALFVDAVLLPALVGEKERQDKKGNRKDVGS